MGECMHVIYNVRLTVGTNVERISYKDTISFRFKMYMVYLDVFPHNFYFELFHWMFMYDIQNAEDNSIFYLPLYFLCISKYKSISIFPLSPTLVVNKNHHYNSLNQLRFVAQ